MEGTEDLYVQVLKDSPAYGGWECINSGGGNWRGPPRPGHLRGVQGGDIVGMVIGSGDAL